MKWTLFGIAAIVMVPPTASAQLDAPWLTPVLLRGQQVIEPGLFVDHISEYHLRSAETGVFLLRVDGSERIFGLVAKSGEEFRFVARNGEAAPGGFVERLRMPRRGQFFINADTAVAFSARTDTDLYTLPPAAGIWYDQGSGLTLLTKTGRPAPGTDGSFIVGLSQYDTLEEFDLLGLSDDGEVAFHAYIGGDGIDDTNNQGVWRGQPDDIRYVMRLGDPAPGTQGVFTAINRAFALPSDVSSHGLVILAETDDATATSGVWVHDGNVFEPRLLIGMSAPGIDGTFEWFGDVTVNRRGQYAFRAAVVDAEGQSTTTLWADRGDGPELVRSAAAGAGPFDAQVRSLFGPTIGPNGEVGYLLSLRGPIGTPNSPFAVAIVDDGVRETVLAVQHRPAPLTGDVATLMHWPGFDATGRPYWSLGLGENARADGVVYTMSDSGEPRVLIRNEICLDINPDPALQEFRAFTRFSIDTYSEVNAVHIGLNAEHAVARGVYIADLGVFTSGCLADLDKDGDVDLADFAIFSGQFALPVCDCGDPCGADFDGNGAVDLGDFGLFGREFGRVDCLQ